jgi:hypothetical protein
MDQAESGAFGRLFSPNSPDSPEASSGTGSFPHKESRIAFLSSVVLLI